MTRSLRLLRGVGALAVLLLVVFGVPVLLVSVMRLLHMTPHGIPSLGQITTVLKRRDDGQLVGGLLVAGIWICWALFTVSLVPEITAVARKQKARELRGLSWVQRPAGALVAAVVIGFTIAPLGGGVATADDADAATTKGPPPASTQLAAPKHPGPAQAPATRQGVASATARTAPPSYEVRRRDTLWGIAERYLNDPLRYVEIVRLNPAAVGPDNEIIPGTVLILPADATGLPGHQPAEAARTARTDVTVRSGDSLWGIEQRLTGSGANWREAWQGNAGRAEPGGERFTDPDLIKPGWTLSINTAAAGGAQGPPAAVTHPVASSPGGTAVPTPHPRPATADPTPASPTVPPASAARAPDGTAVVPHRGDAPSRSSDLSPMVGFAGGGGLLLAGVSLTALIGYRRRQFRRRHPGRTISGSPPELIRAERAVLASGGVGITDVNWLDQALRGLVHRVAAEQGGRLPDVIAVRMSDDELTLILTGPSPAAPAPWRVDDSGSRWSVRRDDPLGYDGSRRGFYFAPFPTLTSVGYTATGEHWLLDLERVGALSLTGDVERCLNLARFFAAELAHNTWSEMLQVTLVGFGEELVAANPNRLTYTDNLTGALEVISGQIESVTAAMGAAGVDVLSGRLHDIAGDQWAAQVLLIAPHLAADRGGLDALLETMKRQPGRTSVALVLADDPDAADSCRWQLRIDKRGMLTIPALGVELIAEQVPAEEAAQLARMLALAAVAEDQPIPPAHGDQPWDEYSDALGGLTIGTGPLDAAPIDAPDSSALHLAESTPWMTNSVLPLSAQTYLERAATTAADLRALAPIVDDEIRAQVEKADPSLDDDLAQWADPDCPRPRICLLGPVQVRAQGSLPERSPQPAFHTEAVVYLAIRPAGALSHDYAQAMWPRDPDVVGKTKVRQSIVAVRKWLGRDPETGEEYLPSGLHEAGPARYRINKALIDAELFRRLRTRGLARGVDGIDDLWRALDLVRGRPFSDIPSPREGSPGGYEWLTDANCRMDHEYSAMIVDVAHTVAIRHFGAAEPERAARAAQVALKGGSYEDVPLLDLVTACLTLDKEAEAEVYVRQILSNHDAEVEEDLPPRTAEVLFSLRRRWADRAS